MHLDWSARLISCDCLSSNTDWIWTVARTVIPPFGALCPNERKLQKLGTRDSKKSNATSSWPGKSSYIYAKCWCPPNEWVCSNARQ